ncbi:DUF1800 domain-containing protein [Flaviaesturariibacter amylovorans]|uniref:DUF1800 domain-containing protein n=1 Tax=Flaviaesturariibacter amylovorans TaxID=1084520 RepID=A0ABP8GAP7_9BACT
MATQQQKNQHLLWRTGFGPAAGQLARLGSSTPDALYREIRSQSAAEPAYIDVMDDYLRMVYIDMKAPGQPKFVLDAAAKKKMLLSNKAGIQKINLNWIAEMVNSPAQLREKMALFWHGHFATRVYNVYFQQLLLHSTRKHALGSFRTLLHEVSKSAAMLNFLNAQSNRKASPNENFAREVMELFTLGRGNYTERDIKEAARAFTGWGANFKGEFQMRPQYHDDGPKTVFGKTANYTGEQVLDLLLEQKATARYITGKIYRYLVSETPDTTRINALADRFYANDYHIGKLLDDIFTADWFYADKYIGARIKSPIDLIAGMQRILPMTFQDRGILLDLQRILGQILFSPPNVAGWPGGRTWIDSASLMARMRLPRMITERDVLDLKPKGDDDLGGGVAGATIFAKGKVRALDKDKSQIAVAIDWKDFQKHFEKVPRTELVPALAGALLQTPMQVPPSLLDSYTDASSRESFIRTTAIQLMCLPEYQLC